MFRSRWKGIAHYLPLAARKSHDVEHVHQLRVWTRRADAVVNLCRALLSKRQRRDLEKQLEVLREAAANARDADVLRQKAAGLKAGVAREHLVALLDKRRLAAQGSIVAACDQLRGGKDLRKQLKQVVSRLTRKKAESAARQPFGKWSRKGLRPLVKKFLRRGERDLSDLATLHKFRIAGKRLRYSMELVAGTFGKSFRTKLYLELDRLQTQLGAINDTRQLIAQVEQDLKTSTKRTLKAQLRRTLAEQQRALASALQAWEETWTKKRRQRLQRAFERHLD